jgi:hypothetical protein
MSPTDAKERSALLVLVLVIRVDGALQRRLLLVDNNNDMVKITIE